MFNFLRKTILRRSFTGRLLSLENFSSVKYISSTANEHSFTVSYLIDSCGLSLESAVSASKFVHLENPENADSVIRFFKNNGFSKTQIATLVRKRPQFLLSSPERTLLPKFNFLYSKGFSISDLAKVLSAQPSILYRSLNKQIIPSFNFLSEFLKSDVSTISAIKLYPRMFSYDVQALVLKNAMILGDNGVPKSNICPFLRHWPSVVAMNSESLMETIEKLKEMGFDPKERKFGVAIFVSKGMGKSAWDKKVDAYKKWGLTEGDIIQAFVKNPLCMVSSEDKIMAIMGYLVKEMGFEASCLLKYPALTTFSLQKRIVPRGSVAKALLSKGLIKKDGSLLTLFHMTEELFLKRIVNQYEEEAPQLLKLFKENLIIHNNQKSVKHGVGLQYKD